MRTNTRSIISSSAIPSYLEISDLYAAAKLKRDPASPLFDALDVKVTKSTHPPLLSTHRRGFFQITLMLSKDRTHDALHAAGPTQAVVGEDYLQPAFPHDRGITVLFKEEILAHQFAAPSNEFPYFCLPATLQLPLNKAQSDQLLPHFRSLQNLTTGDTPYRDKQAAGLLAALLYAARWIYEKTEATVDLHQLCTQLSCRFEDIVLQHFQTHHSVEDYAKLLHVSPDHLSAEVKAKTGRNAREFIIERLMTEAKHLLSYSELNVAEIADHLGFTEATHFTRFFKRQLEESPLQFRNRIQGLDTFRARSKPSVLSRATG